MHQTKEAVWATLCNTIQLSIMVQSSWYSVSLCHSHVYGILHCCDIFIALYHQMDKQALGALGTLKCLESNWYLEQHENNSRKAVIVLELTKQPILLQHQFKPHQEDKTMLL